MKMKKRFFTVFFAAAMVMIAGCGNCNNAKEIPTLLLLQDSGKGVKIYVDSITGVEYMLVKGYTETVISVRYNADGTPMIYEDVEGLIDEWKAGN